MAKRKETRCCSGNDCRSASSFWYPRFFSFILCLLHWRLNHNTVKMSWKQWIRNIQNIKRWSSLFNTLAAPALYHKTDLNKSRLFFNLLKRYAQESKLTLNGGHVFIMLPWSCNYGFVVIIPYLLWTDDIKPVLSHRLLNTWRKVPLICFGNCDLSLFASLCAI